MEFQVFFASAEWFRMEFRELSYIFVTQNGPSIFLFPGMVWNRILRVCYYFCYTDGIQCIFLFCGMVRNGIPRVCLYFCSTVPNSEHFSLSWNGSEQNSQSFLFCGTAGIPPEQTNCSVYSALFFCRKLPTQQ